jgi:hypothetical protein
MTTPTLREALQLIADTDPLDAALDPQRAVRVARAALAQPDHAATLAAVHAGLLRGDDDSELLALCERAWKAQPVPDADPVAWLCKLMQEDGSTRQQIVTQNPDGLRWNDMGEPSPYSVTPLYAAPVAQQADPQPEVTVTTDETGAAVAVTLTDEDGRIVRVLWEAAAHPQRGDDELGQCSRCYATLKACRCVMRGARETGAELRAYRESAKACAAAHPQQPAPLTDAQIDAACGPCDDSDMGRALRAEFIKRFRIVYGRLAGIVPAPTTDQSQPQR